MICEKGYVISFQESRIIIKAKPLISNIIIFLLAQKDTQGDKDYEGHDTAGHGCYEGDPVLQHVVGGEATLGTPVHRQHRTDYLLESEI